MVLIVLMLMIVGFGTKAGMFPMHGWLPTAHPVAPAPASAVLSGIITKAGVLAIIRVIFYTAGADFLRGTWVQYTWMTLTLITVFMGSMMAYKEQVLKKRLAYSTVSQVSYILFGLSLLNVSGMMGALSHFVFHSVVKNCLFLAAGAIIYKTGHTRVEELKGIGKEMPVTMWCFTLVSITLVGIPPTSGFVSKWYLAEGSLTAGTGIFAWLGPVVLLLSALLTAGYLLPISIQGFFPGQSFDYEGLQKKEPNLLMTVPMVLYTVAAVLFGMFPGPFMNFLQNIAAGIF
jgi:multicomponent Na+:H+ antiporter subunit D